MSAPVPAGIRRPTMTFSLRPTRLSTLPVYSRFGKDSGGFLERSRRNERLGLQARLGDALQHRQVARRLAAFGLHFGVLGVELQLVGHFADQEGGIATVDHFHLLQHLADDHFDVLVIDLHALQTIDVLDLLDQVVGQGLDAHDAQDVVAAPGCRP